MKTFKGKAIYNPSGKAGEYSYWACNFYVGCSNGCEYCYCKKGLLKAAMGQNNPQLKKCFRDEEHALEILEKEFRPNVAELKKHGLFFSFTTDPMLPEVNKLTRLAMRKCLSAGVPVKILTKCTEWVNDFFEEGPDYYISGWPDWNITDKKIRLIAFGFTLTGHDELEPGASSNLERINAMRKLKKTGFKTWASIEPIISFGSSLQMIERSMEYCDLYKIGLLSGQKVDIGFKRNLSDFSFLVMEMARMYSFKVYWKDSIRKYLPAIDLASAVGREYNIFKKNG